MRTAFAKTSNVDRFLAGVAATEERGAKEASMVLVTGEPGYGKTATVLWWTTQNEGVYIRAKASYTPHWILAELVREMGHSPSRNSEDLFNQALALMARHPRSLIIDEVEHTLHDSRVLETIRDLSDLIQCPVILVGMDQVQARIARFAQISSRIASVVLFRPATLKDVRVCCETLCEVPVAEDLVEEILRQTAGRIREVLNAIATVERAGKRKGGRAVSLADMAGQVLTHDWHANRPRVVKVSGTGASLSRRPGATEAGPSERSAAVPGGLR